MFVEPHPKDIPSRKIREQTVEKLEMLEQGKRNLYFLPETCSP